MLLRLGGCLPTKKRPSPGCQCGGPTGPDRRPQLWPPSESFKLPCRRPGRRSRTTGRPRPDWGLRLALRLSRCHGGLRATARLSLSHKPAASEFGWPAVAASGLPASGAGQPVTPSRRIGLSRQPPEGSLRIGLPGQCTRRVAASRSPARARARRPLASRPLAAQA